MTQYQVVVPVSFLVEANSDAEAKRIATGLIHEHINGNKLEAEFIEETFGKQEKPNFSVQDLEAIECSALDNE